jgi:hypothetical protein
MNYSQDVMNMNIRGSNPCINIYHTILITIVQVVFRILSSVL